MRPEEKMTIIRIRRREEVGKRDGEQGPQWPGHNYNASRNIMLVTSASSMCCQQMHYLITNQEHNTTFLRK